MTQGGGMHGKYEITGIEAFGSPRSAEIPSATMRRRNNRGMPPPATTFDIDAVAGNSDLTAVEGSYHAAATRPPRGTTPRMRKAGGVLKRTYVLGPAKRSQIKRRRFAKPAPWRKTSGPINNWKGF
jgi:hypothetical protein